MERTEAGSVDRPGRIVVSGTGRVAVAPDTADLRVGIALVRPTVAVARADAAAVQSAVLDAVVRAGVERMDVRTSSLAIHPRYDHRDAGPVLTGYELSNLVEVTIRDLSRVGEVVDGALAAGATSLDGLTFRVADPAPVEDRAREAAFEASRAAATTLARAAGLELGTVVDIVEGDGRIPSPFSAKAERMAVADLSTPVEGGTTEVAVTVTVTFASRPLGN